MREDIKINNSKIDKFKKEELKTIVKNSNSMNEVIGKLGYSTNGGNNFKTVKNKLKELNISTEHFDFKLNKRTVRTTENVFCKNSTASQAILRRWYKKHNYTEYKCSICNLPPIWNNKELTLTLDHIDGNNKNNQLSNLRWVCPNCDRQLPTFGTKNLTKDKEIVANYCIDCNREIGIKSKRCSKCNGKLPKNKEDLIKRRKKDRPSRDELKTLIRSTPFTTIGKLFDVSDNAIRKWCVDYYLPFKFNDIKSYSNEEWEMI